MKLGYEILNNPFLNKGTAFTKKEREKQQLTTIFYFVCEKYQKYE